MRWGQLIAVMVLLGAAAPAQGRTVGVFTYETVYTGAYSYGYGTSCPGGLKICQPGDGTQRGESYTWLADKLDTFVSKDDGTFKETIRYSLGAAGSRVEHVYSDGRLYYSVACTISSKPKLAWIEKRSGRYGGRQVKPDPLVTVSWQVPYLTNDPPEGFSSGPGLQVACPGAPASTGAAVMTYTSQYADEAAHHQFGCGDAWLEPSDAFYTLWGSETKVKLSALPYKRTFGFRNQIFVPAHGEISSCRENVLYASRLSFAELTSAPRGVGIPDAGGGTGTSTGPINPNKVGALLLAGGLSELLGTGSPIDNGDPETVLFPGMPGSGDATTQVTGQVVSPGADAAAAQVLFKGAGRATSQNPFTVVLSPTAAARHLLGGAHGAVKLTATVRFKPSGGGKAIVAHSTLTVPAAS